MRKRIDRKKLILIFSIFFVSVISLSVVYAALSTTLRISGSSNVNASSWNIRFEKTNFDDFLADVGHVDNYFVYGEPTIINDPVVSNTSVSDYSLSLTKPGDGLWLHYNVINDGTIPAIYTSGIINNISVTSKINSSSDIEWGRKNFINEFYLWGLDGQTTYDEGHVLCPGDIVILQVRNVIDSKATTLPSDEITLSNLGVQLLFTQGDLSLCS